MKELTEKDYEELKAENEKLNREYADGLLAWKANNEHHQKEIIAMMRENWRLKGLLKDIEKAVNNALHGEIK